MWEAIENVIVFLALGWLALRLLAFGYYKWQVRANAFIAATNFAKGGKSESDWCEDGLTGRAMELADMVSDMIWGGERGWERADKAQFQHLKREARKRMKAGGIRLAESTNESRTPYCSGCGDWHSGRRCYS
jgi:hypothetical protein